MPEDWRKMSTELQYRGLEVTLIGNITADLLVIAGYGTRDELAIGAITMEHRDGRRVYCLANARGCLASAQAAAEAVIRAHKTRDARGD
jgi:hypothetical protein